MQSFFPFFGGRGACQWVWLGAGSNEHQAPTSGAPLSTSPKKLCASLFMGLKINAFRFIKEKPHFWADILDFGGRHLGILCGQRAFLKEWDLKSICTKFHACITK